VEFKKRKFKKIKSLYYRCDNRKMLCGIEIQRSNYGAMYYINVNFFIGDYSECNEYPSIYDADLWDRLIVHAKPIDASEPQISTRMIRIERYSEEELADDLRNEFDNFIIPIIENGKEEVLKRLERLHTTPSKTIEEVLKKFNMST